MVAPAGILLRDFHPKPLLRRPEHVPARARFPAIDAHNHLFGDLPPEALVAVMDEVGVAVWVNVSGNVVLPLENNTYTIARVPIDGFIDGYVKRYPGRFACFTMADFAQWGDFCLLKKGGDFTGRCVATLEQDVHKGAVGLKVTKELGLRFTDADGRMLPVDDRRLYPVWKRAGELGIPTLMHVSDPIGFFLPRDAANEHLPVLEEFPGWSFHGSFYSKDELLSQRNRLIADHPRNVFILPHVANLPEDLDSVSRLLDAHPNVFIDLSARLDELGRQPYTARDFLIHYQDRVMFGMDMMPRSDLYRCHFRFFETRDEYFETPDYIGRWGRSRWRVHGLHLPDSVLEKLYVRNACRIIPGLR